MGGEVVWHLPLTGALRLGAEELAVIEHPAVQRLRRVRAVGAAWRVFPGAVHSRLEHALGVWALAARAWATLAASAPGFAEQAGGEAGARTLRAAALLHDLGHYPLAHELEASFHGQDDAPKHEALGAAILAGAEGLGAGLGEVLEEAWGVDPARVGRLIQRGSPEEPAEDALLRSVLSGAVDIDKMDYLRRDSHHMGVDWGLGWEEDALLRSLGVRGDGRGLGVRAAGVEGAVAFAQARARLYVEGYWHPALRANAAAMEAALVDLQRSGALPARRAEMSELLLAHDDEGLLAWLAALAPAGSVAARVLERLRGPTQGFYRVALTLEGAEVDGGLGGLYEALRGLSRGALEARVEVARRRLGLEPGELLVDLPPRDKRRVEDMVVLEEGGGEGSLWEQSAVLREVEGALGRGARRMRVFVVGEVRGEVGEALG